MKEIKTISKYDWNEKEKTATYVIEYEGNKFVGKAYCNSKDSDMASERTGLYIAELRANLKLLRFLRDIIIPNRLQSLYQFYYSINHSKQFNPKSYEAKMLHRQIKLNEKDLEEIKDTIVIIKSTLKEYIDAKDKVYNLLRKHRAAKSV